MNLLEKIQLEYGNRTEFSKVIGYTTTSVYRWIKEGFPVGKLKIIEERTGGKITKELMRPDLF
jgi:DNA-binding transcriptional regulator YdaS (Cro superfamily)